MRENPINVCCSTHISRFRDLTLRWLRYERSHAKSTHSCDQAEYRHLPQNFWPIFLKNDLTEQNKTIKSIAR